MDHQFLSFPNTVNLPISSDIGRGAGGDDSLVEVEVWFEFWTWGAGVEYDAEEGGEVNGSEDGIFGVVRWFWLWSLEAVVGGTGTREGICIGAGLLGVIFTVELFSVDITLFDEDWTMLVASGNGEILA